VSFYSPTATLDNNETPSYCILMSNTAIESLRTFAMAHNEIAFAHLCTAALAGEEWAMERITQGSATYPHTPVLRYPGYSYSVYQGDLRIIRATDTTRPDGASARATNVTAAFPRPSTCTDTAGAIDIDVTVTINGVTVNGEVTLAPQQYDGELGAFGDPDQWVSGDLLRHLRMLDDSGFRAVLNTIETAAGDAVLTA
jgi:hypothetical protein